VGKRIVMLAFRSFADRTSVDFSRACNRHGPAQLVLPETSVGMIEYQFTRKTIKPAHFELQDPATACSSLPCGRFRLR